MSALRWFNPVAVIVLALGDGELKMQLRNLSRLEYLHQGNVLQSNVSIIFDRIQLNWSIIA